MQKLTYQHKKDVLAELNQEAIVFDEFEDALIGYGKAMGQEYVAVYRYEKMIEILMRDDEMSYEDAVDCLEYNTVQAYLGPSTPIILYDFD
jgi:hypothetical protein